ncbi:hypothetical protein BGX21_007595, partial [Mortierella sp. AD011]
MTAAISLRGGNISGPLTFITPVTAFPRLRGGITFFGNFSPKLPFFGALGIGGRVLFASLADKEDTGGMGGHVEEAEDTRRVEEAKEAGEVEEVEDSGRLEDVDEAGQLEGAGRLEGAGQLEGAGWLEGAGR